MSLTVSILNRLQTQHSGLDLLTAELTEPQLRKMVQAGKWSVFENIVHLATYQHEFLKRIDTIMREENPSFTRYTAESDPLFHDNLERPTIWIMAELVETRNEIFNKIVSLTLPEINRKGLHPVFGSLTILQWTEFFLLHEAHHHLTIFKLAAELRREPASP
jgi:DinB family protein